MLAADAVDLLALARAQALVRIEAPDAFEQALAAQHLVAAGDAAAEVVGDVEEGAVAVGDAAVEREQLALDRAARLGARQRGLAALEQLDRALRPDRPVAEQAAAKAHRHRRAVAHRRERRDQVEDDVVVVAGVERDALLGARRDHAADDVERAVAVERRDLDRDDVVDRGEAGPERGAEVEPADRRLQVEADQRHLARRRRRNARSARRRSRPCSAARLSRPAW